MAIGIPTAKYGPLFLISTLGFILSNVDNIFILVILYEFLFAVSTTSDEIVHVGNFRSHRQIADRGMRWKVTNRTANLVFQTAISKDG
jgi:hypothetical protein